MERRPQGPSKVSYYGLQAGFKIGIAAAVLLTMMALWISIGAEAATAEEQRWIQGDAPPSFSSNSATGPSVAVNSAGEALVAWREENASGPGVIVSRLNATREWSAPVRVNEPGPADIQDIRVEFPDTGDALVVWRARANSLWRLEYAFYESGWGWLTPGILYEDATGNVTYLSMAGDERGEIVVVWAHEVFGGTKTLWSAIFNPYGAWEQNVLLDEVNGSVRFEPAVDMNRQGHAMVVWRTNDGYGGPMRSIWYNTSMGWSEVETGAHVGAFQAISPQVTVDQGGNATAVWQQFTGGSVNIFANRFTVGTGWGSETQIDFNDGGADEHSIRSFPNGSAVAIFRPWGYNGMCSCRPDLVARVYDPSSGWGDTVQMENDDNLTYEPRLATDAKGNALAVWIQGDQAWSRRYGAFGGWQNSTPVASEAGGLGGLSLQSTATGRAVAVWVHGSGPESLSAAYYEPDLTPPSLLVESPVPGLTNRTQVMVAGITEPNSRVWIQGSQVTTTSNGSFAADVRLTEGMNEILVEASDMEGNRASTGIVMLVDTAPPNLEVAWPPGDAWLDVPVVTVRGHTEPGALLTLRGARVATDDGGNFSFDLALSDGTNEFLIEAQDEAGNIAQRVISATFENPWPSFAQELNASQGRAENLSRLLNETNTELNETNESLEAARSEIDDLSKKIAKQSTDLESANQSIAEMEKSLQSTMLLAIGGLVFGVASVGMALFTRAGLAKRIPPPKEPGGG